MKKLIFVFGILLSLNVGQAQYQDLVDQKITQLLQLQAQVTSVEFVGQETALDTLAVNLEQLISHRNEVDVAKLQNLESTINQINQQLTQEVLKSKKARLQQKLDELSAVIATRKADHKSVSEVERLCEKMNATLQNL